VCGVGQAEEGLQAFYQMLRGHDTAALDWKSDHAV